MGRLSDRIGRKPVLLTGCILFFVLTYPAFSVIASGVSLSTIMLVQFGLGVMLAVTSGVSPTAISEIFPTHNRTTWMSIGYTLSVTIFGGFAPFIAAWLVKETGSSMAPSYYVMAASRSIERYRRAQAIVSANSVKSNWGGRRQSRR